MGLVLGSQPGQQSMSGKNPQMSQQAHQSGKNPQQSTPQSGKNPQQSQSQTPSGNAMSQLMQHINTSTQNPGPLNNAQAQGSTLLGNPNAGGGKNNMQHPVQGPAQAAKQPTSGGKNLG